MIALSLVEYNIAANTLIDLLISIDIAIVLKVQRQINVLKLVEISLMAMERLQISIKLKEGICTISPVALIYLKVKMIDLIC